MALLASVSEVSRVANDQAHYQHELEQHSQEQDTSLLHLQPLNRPRAMNAATLGSTTSLMRAHYNSKKNTELKLQQEFQKRAEETGRVPLPTVPKKRGCCSTVFKVRRSIFALFDDPSSSIFAKLLNLFIMSVIIISTITFIIETLPDLHRKNEEVWFAMETVVVAIFTVEYTIRLCTCPKLCKFLIDPLNVIDLLAILPFYLELAVSSSSALSQLRVLRTVRLVRIFRIFKLSRYSSSMKIFVMTMTKSADALGLLIFYLVIAVILFSSIMYYIERGDYDSSLGYYIDTEGNKSDFQSIPDTFWWCMVTITTVGYGDVVPKTWLGRCVAMVAMVTGILVMSFPISVIGATFSDMWVEANRKKKQEKIDKMKAKEEEKIPMTTHIENLNYHIIAMKTHKRELEDLFVQAHHLIRTRTKNGQGANKALSYIENIALRHVSDARSSMDKLKDYLEDLPIEDVTAASSDDDDDKEAVDDIDMAKLGNGGMDEEVKPELNDGESANIEEKVALTPDTEVGGEFEVEHSPENQPSLEDEVLESSDKYKIHDGDAPCSQFGVGGDSVLVKDPPAHVKPSLPAPQGTLDSGGEDLKGGENEMTAGNTETEDGGNDTKQEEPPAVDDAKASSP